MHPVTRVTKSYKAPWQTVRKKYVAHTASAHCIVVTLTLFQLHYCWLGVSLSCNVFSNCQALFPSSLTLHCFLIFIFLFLQRYPPQNSLCAPLFVYLCVCFTAKFVLCYVVEQMENPTQSQWSWERTGGNAPDPFLLVALIRLKTTAGSFFKLFHFLLLLHFYVV